MTVAEIISKLENLDLEERMQVRAWLDDHDGYSESLDAAIAEGLADIEAGRVQDYTRDELTAQVKIWAGGSR
ncbi:MAG: hypothetical protein JWM33_3891 [Caulobacteraceae bacterium]|nr:hypothetical protein [Caulobacteraceae bacterium]